MFDGDFNLSSMGIAVHFVPVELWSTLHVLQDCNPALSEYFPEGWSHEVHFGACLVAEYFPASHGAQETAPEVLA
jgi:hypothetical protein